MSTHLWPHDWRPVFAHLCLGLLMATALGIFAAQTRILAADAPAPTTAAPQINDARAAFLKLVDRPRVDPRAEEKPLDPPAGTKDLSLFRIEYSTEADQRVPALLLRPSTVAGGKRLPVVILLHGTSSKKESNIGLMKTLAGKGFIAVSPDGRYHGERKKGDGTEEYFAKIAQAFANDSGFSGPGKTHPWLFDTAWDVMRLIDVLSARADVDPARIGVMGFSKGGMETYLTAFADTRVAVAIPCIGVQSFKWGLENNNWKGRVGTVKGAFDAAAKQAGVATPNAAFAKSFYDRVIPGIDGPFDCPNALTYITPRPLLIINGDSDDKTPLPGVLIAAESAKRAYQAANAADKFELIIQEKTGHKVLPENTAKAVAWFEKWLMPR